MFQQAPGMSLDKTTKLPASQPVSDIKCEDLGSRGKLHHLNIWFSLCLSPPNARIRHKPFPSENSDLPNERW